MSATQNLMYPLIRNRVADAGNVESDIFLVAAAVALAGATLLLRLLLLVPLLLAPPTRLTSCREGPHSPVVIFFSEALTQYP